MQCIVQVFNYALIMQLEIDFKKEELKQELNSFFNNIYSILICMKIIAGK